jgi:hypothetical protein
MKNLYITEIAPAGRNDLMAIPTFFCQVMAARPTMAGLRNTAQITGQSGIGRVKP